MKIMLDRLTALRERFVNEISATVRHQYIAVLFEPRGCGNDGWCDVGCLTYIGKGNGAGWTCWWHPETDQVQLRAVGERRRLAVRTGPPFPVITKAVLAEVLLDGEEAVLRLTRSRTRTTMIVATPAEYEASRENDPMGMVGVVIVDDGRQWQVRYDRTTGERRLRRVES